MLVYSDFLVSDFVEPLSFFKRASCYISLLWWGFFVLRKPDQQII